MSTDSHKRARSSSPERKEEGPMVEDVEYKGFLSQSRYILKKYKGDKNLKDQAESMLESVGEHFLENSVGAARGMRGVVQLVHTLLEVAAAVTSVVPAAKTEEDKAKIKQLNDYAMEGLKMIGAEDVDFHSDLDDDE